MEKFCMFHPEPGTVNEFIPTDHTGDDDERKDRKNEPFLLVWKIRMENEKNGHRDKNKKVLLPGPAGNRKKA